MYEFKCRECGSLREMLASDAMPICDMCDCDEIMKRVYSFNSRPESVTRVNEATGKNK